MYHEAIANTYPPPFLTLNTRHVGSGTGNLVAAQVVIIRTQLQCRVEDRSGEDNDLEVCQGLFRPVGAEIDM